jgi:hypothetical protein
VILKPGSTRRAVRFFGTNAPGLAARVTGTASDGGAADDAEFISYLTVYSLSNWLPALKCTLCASAREPNTSCTVKSCTGLKVAEYFFRMA